MHRIDDLFLSLFHAIINLHPNYNFRTQNVIQRYDYCVRLNAHGFLCLTLPIHITNANVYIIFVSLRVLCVCLCFFARLKWHNFLFAIFLGPWCAKIIFNMHASARLFRTRFSTESCVYVHLFAPIHPFAPWNFSLRVRTPFLLC